MLVLAALAPLALPPVQDTAPATRPTAIPAHLQDAEAARLAAVAWLVAHQDDDGKWDSDAFAKHDADLGKPKKPDALWDDRWLDEKPVPRPVGDGVEVWSGEGAPLHDVGVTGLAVLALLADGHTMTQGKHSDAVKRGVKWLCEQQDGDTGLIGEPVGHTYVYDHAIASLALCELTYLDQVTIVGKKAQAAVSFIERARNPYGAWRYDVPPNGDNDTSVTTWMVLALGAAERAGLEFDRAAFRGAESWYDEMTDPNTGRVGYTETGSVSSRVPGMNTQFPADGSETLTAAALLGRLTLGQKPAGQTVMIDHVRLMLASLPDAPPANIDDVLFVFFGARATSWLGGKPWQRWSETFIPALVALQSKEGAMTGSWDPKNAWGFSMGRVGTTAILAWTLASVEGAPADGSKQRAR